MPFPRLLPPSAHDIRSRRLSLRPGTFLGGRVIIGEYTRESGPDGMAAAKPLTESLRGLGLRLQRFKTGTPPRINRRSIDYTDLAEQAGEDEIIPFSFETDHPPDNRAGVLSDLHNRENT